MIKKILTSEQLSDIICERLETALISIKNLVLLKNTHPFHDENQGTCNSLFASDIK